MKKLFHRFSLLLLLLLTCGAASAELVYSVESGDFSIGRVSYDAGGFPQNETVLKDIKASGVSFTDVFSTDKGEWRVLTSTTSSDSTFSLTLCDPDRDWANPLGKSRNFSGSASRDVSDPEIASSGILVVSGDSGLSSSSQSFDIFKLNKETLAVIGQTSIPSQPLFDSFEEVIIYSCFNGYTGDGTDSPASFTLLGEDLKERASSTYDGYYCGSPVFFDSSSCALPFRSQDVYSNTTDIGIFRISGSTRTTIVSSSDVGVTGATGYYNIDYFDDDGSGGLCFFVSKNTITGGDGSSTLYHWDGSKTTPVYHTQEGETLAGEFLACNDNLFFMVYKYDEKTKACTSYALYRWSPSQAAAAEILKLTDGSVLNSFAACDDTNIAYFTAGKKVEDETEPTCTALYRYDASQATATEIFKAPEGCKIDRINDEYNNFETDSSGGIYFIVSRSETATDENGLPHTTCTSSALYGCGASQATAARVYEVTDGSCIILLEAESNDISFAVVKEAKEAKAAAEDTSPYYWSSLAICHYNGSDVSTIHTFSDVLRDDMNSKDNWKNSGRMEDKKHKTLYLWAASRDPAAGSTLLAFDNTDRHHPEKLKEFEIAGKIYATMLYNNAESGSVMKDGGGSSGCDAGFGALALALAAVGLLKKRGR